MTYWCRVFYHIDKKNNNNKYTTWMWMASFLSKLQAKFSLETTEHHCSYWRSVIISFCGMCTCWLSQTLPGEGLPLLPLVQLPHGVVPHRPPLLRSGDGSGGGRTEGTIIHGARHAADAVGPHHAVARQRAVALWVAGHNLSTVARHVPG